MIKLDVQNASSDNELPDNEMFNQWVVSALESREQDTELTIRIVDEDESKQLNLKWRKKDYATNVLSFPMENLPKHTQELLGDIVVCAPVIKREAKDQGKKLIYHWAHMIIHGTLHLIGYDHNNDDEAELMENQEIAILEKLGIPDPYN